MEQAGGQKRPYGPGLRGSTGHRDHGGDGAPLLLGDCDAPVIDVVNDFARVGDQCCAEFRDNTPGQQLLAVRGVERAVLDLVRAAHGGGTSRTREARSAAMQCLPAAPRAAPDKE